MRPSALETCNDLPAIIIIIRRIIIRIIRRIIRIKLKLDLFNCNLISVNKYSFNIKLEMKSSLCY